MNVKKNINYKKAFPFSLPLLITLYKSKIIKCKDEDYDHLSLPYDNIEGNDLTEILNNPNFEGDKELLMEESMFNSISPPQFAYLHSQFKTPLDQESWKGLKLSLAWHPTMTLNSEFSLTIDKPRGFLNNYTISTTSILANEQNPNKGTVFLGRLEGSQKKNFQAHIDVTNNDKVIVSAHYMHPDPNQGAYELEYNRKMDRIHLDFKYSPMGLTFSGVTALTKGTFFGFEALYSANAPNLIYSYGAKVSLPIKNLHCAMTYIGYMPYLMIDLMYKFNNNLGFYFNYSKNDMMGKNEYKASAKYKYQKFDIMAGVENLSNIHCLVNYNYNKHITFQGNMELSPAKMISKRSRSSSYKVGFGINFSSSSQEDLISNHETEDFSNFDYDEYLKA